MKKAGPLFSWLNLSFPLTSGLDLGFADVWRQWLADEEKLLFQNGESQITSKEVQSLLDLFERAVLDYLAPDLWLDFCAFLSRVHFAPNNAPVDEMQTDDSALEPFVTESEVRERFEEALATLAFHIPASHRLWQAYRRFEEAIADLAAANGKKEVLQGQLEKIRVLYSRQLLLPGFSTLLHPCLHHRC